jgi:hypothetical protein
MPSPIPRIATSPLTPAGTSVTSPGRGVHEEQRLRQRGKLRDLEHREIALEREPRAGGNPAGELGLTEQLPEHQAHATVTGHGRIQHPSERKRKSGAA